MSAHGSSPLVTSATESEPLLSERVSARGPSSWSAVGRRVGVTTVSVCAVVLTVVASYGSKTRSALPSLSQWLYDNPPAWYASWGSSLSPEPGRQGDAKFTLHSYCKPEDVKFNYADFWMDGEKEAYVVRHNYGSVDFFSEESAVKMERVILDEATGERGYTVDTADVDFEFGFALKNLKTGEWYREIGKGSESSLYNEPCVQQYGAFYNRVRTSQPDPDDIETVIGSCDAVCDPNYVDTANQVRSVDQIVPAAPGTLVVGKSNDARLFTLHSIKIQFHRSATQRDLTYPETENSARFIAAYMDPRGPGTGWQRGREYILMASVMVSKDGDDNIGISVNDFRYHKLDSPCVTTECSAALYDLSELWNDESKTTSWRRGSRFPSYLANPLYTLGVKGDSRPEFFEMSFPDTAYLTRATLFGPGAWGKDIDARRVTLVSGAACGTPDSWDGTCNRNFHPIEDETVAATKDEKFWIYAIYGGIGCGAQSTCITMVRVRVYVDSDESLKIEALGAARDVGITDAEIDQLSDLSVEHDVKNTPRTIGDLYHNARWPLQVATSKSNPSSGSMGIGGIKFVRAPEMVPSLALPPARAPSLGARPTPSKTSSSRSADAAALGQAITSLTGYNAPHYSDHEYPGVEGCEATCEGTNVDEATCVQNFNCEWMAGKCWSRVGPAQCAASEQDLLAALNGVINPASGSTPVMGCTTECEHETRDACAAHKGGAVCEWSEDACWPIFIEPCPV